MNKKFVQEIEYKGENQRLDMAVSECFDLTRSQAQKKIREEKVSVDGKLSRAKDEVKTGQMIQLSLDEIKNVTAPRVLFEDAEILVIDKPTGMSVHPSAGEKDKTVVELFTDKLKFANETERPGVVHRLDKGTSGVMVLAKTRESLEKLQKEFKNRNVKKTYLALIRGVIYPESGVINMPILRDLNKKERMSVAKEGKEAVTEFATIKTFKDKYALLELNPKTGRTHQIRVHLSALGYPIMGDFKYGPKDKVSLGRIFLHAKKLEFRHPKTEKIVSFASELPKELEDFLSLIN